MTLVSNLLDMLPPDEKEDSNLPLLDDNDDHTETAPTAPIIKIEHKEDDE